MDKRADIPPFETRAKLVAGLAVPYLFFAFLLGKLVGYKAAIAVLALFGFAALLYIAVPGLFFRRPKVKPAGGSSAEGASHH